MEEKDTLQIDGLLHLENRAATNQDIERIREVCSYSTTMADLIVGWVTHMHRSLSIISAPDHDDRYLMIAFEREKINIGMLFCETATEIAQYPGFKPLNRNVQKFADMDGVVPDYEWIEKRDQRLKVVWDDENGFCVTPPRSFGELILSYACKQPGLVRIERELASFRYYPCYVYKADLGCFEEIKSYGFHEIIATKADAYSRFATGRFKKNSTKLRPYLARFAHG
jgi:hypothetical protein